MASNTNPPVSAAVQSDPFDEIFLSEDIAEKMGYEEGYSVGKERGVADGYGAGYKEGEQIGEEIGFYMGFAGEWLRLIRQEEEEVQGKDREKITKLLVLFTESLNEFPIMEVEASDYVEKLQQIRVQYRHILSILKLKLEVETTGHNKSSLSF